VALFLAERLGPRPRAAGRDQDVLVTGTFYAASWALAKLRPLAAHPYCRRVYVVTTFPLPCEHGIFPIYPPSWLQRIIGAVPARLITFVWQALRLRPDVVGGFHLLVNGLVALIVARLVGAQALYICGGGPTEVLGGGAFGENRLFRRMEKAQPSIERVLLRAVDRFDLVVTTGTRSRDFFRARGIRAPIVVDPGGVVVDATKRDETPASIDIIAVTRLEPVKRIDRLLRILQAVRGEHPELRAAIVGDGSLRGELEQLSCRLGLERNVRFLGHRVDVPDWLRRARIFVLTSDSEGLPLAVMEAMACGLPPVVSRVGDLADLVEHGTSGYLVEPEDETRFAAIILDLLRDEQRRLTIAGAAHSAAAQHEIRRAAQRWDELFTRNTISLAGRGTISEARHPDPQGR
jgi:glycosyltransferase involved in cell wall biosynthesis